MQALQKACRLLWNQCPVLTQLLILFVYQITSTWNHRCSHGCYIRQTYRYSRPVGQIIATFGSSLISINMWQTTPYCQLCTDSQLESVSRGSITRNTQNTMQYNSIGGFILPLPQRSKQYNIPVDLIAEAV